MKGALLKIEESNEKPLFIDKGFLENVSKNRNPSKNYPIQPQKETIEELEKPTFEGTISFHPYAKDVEAELNIIEDPTRKLTSNGTMEDYLQYFQDRFKRIERLLRQRIDVKAATPILEALKSPAKTKLKIIGMVTEKREAKRQTIVTVEDLQASATVLISNRAPEEVQRKAQLLHARPSRMHCSRKNQKQPVPSRRHNFPRSRPEDSTQILRTRLCRAHLRHTRRKHKIQQRSLQPVHSLA